MMHSGATAASNSASPGPAKVAHASECTHSQQSLFAISTPQFACMSSVPRCLQLHLGVASWVVPSGLSSLRNSCSESGWQRVEINGSSSGSSSVAC